MTEKDIKDFISECIEKINSKDAIPFLPFRFIYDCLCNAAKLARDESIEMEPGERMAIHSAIRGVLGPVIAGIAESDGEDDGLTVWISKEELEQRQKRVDDRRSSSDSEKPNPIDMAAIKFMLNNRPGDDREEVK